MIIELSDKDMALASMAGMMLQRNVEARGAYTDGNRPREVQIAHKKLGAQAEIAVCNYLGAIWSGMPMPSDHNRDSYDVEDWIEVRMAANRGGLRFWNRDLPRFEDDYRGKKYHNDTPFVLCHPGQMLHHVKIVGWIWAQYALELWEYERYYDTDSYVADLEAFVDMLGLDQFVLVGHSMGGHHSLAYTARHPERVRCAVVNDIPPALDRDPDATTARFPGGAHPVYASLEAWMDAERPTQPFTPEHILRFSGETRLKLVEGGFIPRYDAYASIHWQPRDLWDEVRTISRPLLLLRGGRSTVLDAATLQRMDMVIEPARSITLEKAGHNTFFDMEHEFIEVVSAFIAAHA